MKKGTIKKRIADGLLIVFSVLFALAINKLSDNYKTKQRKEIALESIKKELHQNADIVAKWNEKHQRILKRISEISSGKNDSIKNELLQEKFLDLGLLTGGESLINELTTSTAWETAISTGIISEVDFETTQKLTYAYSLQKIITEKSVQEILDIYFALETHKKENLDIVLIQFQLRFGELVGQERSLKHLYQKAIEQIE